MPQNMTELTFEGLEDFKGGLVQRMLEKTLGTIANDLRAAPELPDARKATLEFSFKPICDEGDLTGVIIEFGCGFKTPKRVTSGHFEVLKNDQGKFGFFFNSDSPDNPAQQGLGFKDDDEERGR
jgi:hypothetical protein